MTKPFIKVFDNGGKTFDRFTVVIFDKPKSSDAGHVNVFGMSCNADAPNGFNQYCGTLSELPLVLEALAGDREALSILGREVELTDLPPAVRVGIGNRLI
jgi:hypothetical protein